MIFNEKNSPRKFKVGLDNQIISNCGPIPLELGEQITVVLAVPYSHLSVSFCGISCELTRWPSRRLISTYLTNVSILFSLFGVAFR